MPPKVNSHFSNFFCIGLGPPTTKFCHASSSLTHLPNTPSLLHHPHSHRDPNLHQMNSQNLPWFPFLPFISFLKLLLLFQFHLSSSYSDQYLYTNCGNTFNCGSITGIGYPFRGTGDHDYCGYPGLVLDCSNDNITTIQMGNLTYRVLNFDQSTQTMKIAREDLMESTCPHDMVNTTLDSALFEYTSSTYMNLTFLYGCQAPLKPVPNLIPIPSCNESVNVYLFAGAQGGDLIGCDDSVVIPISGWALPVNSTDQEQAIRGGFEVKWKVDSKECSDCIGSKGRCGYSLFTNQTTCYCPTPPYVWDTCSVAAGETPPGSTNHFNMGIKLTIAFSIIVAVTCLITVIFCLKRRFTSSANAVAFSKKECMDDRNVEAFLRNCGSLAPKRYRYLDLKKITSSFKDKLGQGGYGSVYKGKLSDGRLVAVKVLSQTEGNGQEFINEVASISRTSHINVVNLLGFCFETKRRALIYEFMANGSLDKFIFNVESVNTNCRLEWSTLYQIAVGIARGLEYLHRGCSTRIVHFDIKPHNILLDEDLRPKISDFGLAKLCQTKQSVISMLGARGTAGYIAPEVFSRTFGQVSHKSDVYSYGMMVLEMTGARDQKLGVVQTSEKYFPHWIYEHLEHDKDLSLHGVITTTEEEETVRKMILVGLWCIQTNPSDRPPMSKVVEMLEGSLQSLQIPPKPYLFPPTRANPSTQDTSNSL